MMKRWSFHCYHQPIEEGLARLAEPMEDQDTQWMEWEVFMQEQRGDAHVNVGAVHAPDAEMALMLAKEAFTRRQSCVNLWVVNTRDIHATAYEDEGMFHATFDRSYRNTTGYKLDKPLPRRED